MHLDGLVNKLQTRETPSHCVITSSMLLLARMNVNDTGSALHVTASVPVVNFCYSRRSLPRQDLRQAGNAVKDAASI